MSGREINGKQDSQSQHGAFGWGVANERARSSKALGSSSQIGQSEFSAFSTQMWPRLDELV